MNVYDVQGNIITKGYNANGGELSKGYDVAGNEIALTSGQNPPLDFDLSVMTFNCQGWSGMNSDVAIIEAIMGEYNPDIIGFQEGNLPSSSTFPFASSYNSNTIPIATKNAIALSNQQSFTYSTQSQQYTRYYQRGYITIDNKTIAVFNTHLEFNSLAIRAAQAAELLAALEEETSFILTGDFNVYTHSKTSEEYTTVIKPFIDAGYNLSNWVNGFRPFVDTWFYGSAPGGSNTNPELADHPHDNIITSADIEIVKTYFDKRKINAHTGQTIDHIPIVARLKIN